MRDWETVRKELKERSDNFKKYAKEYSKSERTPKSTSSFKSNENKMPNDSGSAVYDSRGSKIGTRGYTRFVSDTWVATTEYEDGSSVVHCGGPCGDMYVDEFGNA